MTKIDLLNMLKAYADDYTIDCKASLMRNNHMNDVTQEQVDALPQEAIDAILIDFINLVGMKQGVDYGVYTSDLGDRHDRASTNG